MKNITKSLLVAGLVLPCAIGLAACGPKGPLSETAHCNTNGVYAESSLDDYNATVATAVQEQTGYRLTMDVQIQTTGMNANIRTNAIFVNGEFMANITMPYITMNSYLTDGYNYMDMTIQGQTLRTKKPVPTGELGDSLNLYGDLSSFKELMDMVPTDNSLVKVEKITDENEERYRLTMNSSIENSNVAFSDVVIYLNFADGAIQEAKMTSKFITSVQVDPNSPAVEASADFSITMSTYSGELSFPDFSKYTEAQF